MPVLESFCGGFYRARSPIAATELAVNLYTETRQVPGSPKQKWIYGVPGCLLVTTLGTESCRGWFTQDDRTFVTIGNTLYERIDATTYTSRGTIADDGRPVTYASNGDAGDQLGICGGGNLYVLTLSTNAFETVMLPFSDPVMIVFQDGYGLINEGGTPIVWFSTLEDLTVWDALDFFTRNATSDDVVGLSVSRDRVWVFGSKTSTQYYDSGNADNPWQPYPGTTIQVGLVAYTAQSTYNDVIRFIGRSPRGEPKVVQVTADGKVTALSTPPIADFLMNCTTLSDAEMVATYEQGGHPFIVMTCPSSTEDIKSYHYDIGENEWGARAEWLETASGNLYDRWRVRGTTAIGSMILAGDWDTGDIYELSFTTYENNGDVLRRQRRAPYLSQEPQWLYINEVQLQAQVGIGLSDGTDDETQPTVELSLSRDGGFNFISAGLATLGQLGQFLTRPIWRRLGRARADLLVLDLVQTSPVPTMWGPLSLTVQSGTGQL